MRIHKFVHTRQIYIELPRFVKSEEECENFFECWIYNLVNMDKLERISFKDQKAIFGRLEQMVSQANLSKEEREQYETEWKIYNDYFNTIESAEKKAAAEARAEGRAEGREEGRAEGISSIVHYMKSNGMSIEDIAKTTGLALEEIENL